MFSFFSLILTTVCSNLVSAYFIVLTGDENVVPGEMVNFKAEVFEDNNVLSPHEYTFNWKDDANPSHSGVIKGKSPVYWNVTYDLDTLPGIYTVSVEVKKFIFLIKTITVGTQTMQFNVTKYINGEVVLRQGNVTRMVYISNEMAVNHTIALKKSFLNFLNHTKNFMRVFWFVDCIYYGPQSGLEFDFNYTKVDAVHFVEALLVASYDPRLPKNYSIFSPTKVLTVSNKTAELQKALVNTTSKIGNAIQNNASKSELYQGIDNVLIEWLNNFNASQEGNLTKPKDYCLNSSIIPINPNYTYGFFKTNFTVKAPVKTSPINGTNWLMDGEILNINVSCNGSSPYRFCVLLKSGLYNISGNETCKEETLIKNCSFGIQHLFKKPSEYTLVVIISNAVSRVVKPIAVNIYKVKKHAQLSVIIVPVSFSLIATILIIFGVAYYVQSKHKYTIEVADFDFGNQTSSMEYKTFKERLRESISNSFLKSNDFQDDDSAWSESVPTSRKYGSME